MDPKSLIDSGERDHRVISAVSLGLPPTATWSEISDAMLARQAIAAQSQLPKQERVAEPGPSVKPLSKKSEPSKRVQFEDIDTDALHRAALARSEDGNAVVGMGGTVPRSSDYGIGGVMYDPGRDSLGNAMEAIGSPDYENDSAYAGATMDELARAGLVDDHVADESRVVRGKEAPQTWVPMYAPNAKTFR